MKALVAADGDRILGFAMIGAEAGEVMAMAVSRPAAGNSSNEA
jgi:pyruvate/2-oxoglutarate dehydrogenase complex dihydrolipoamide dehydrogenase (E3) component